MIRVVKTKRLTLGIALGTDQGRGSNSNVNGPRLVRLHGTDTGQRARGGTFWFRRGRVWASWKRKEPLDA